MDKDAVHNNTMRSYAAIKNEIMSFTATWLGLEKIILSEVSQKKTNIYHLHMESKKIYTNELVYKIETDSQTYKTNLWLPKRK